MVEEFAAGLWSPIDQLKTKLRNLICEHFKRKNWIVRPFLQTRRSNLASYSFKSRTDLLPLTGKCSEGIWKLEDQLKKKLRNLIYSCLKRLEWFVGSLPLKRQCYLASYSFKPRTYLFYLNRQLDRAILGSEPRTDRSGISGLESSKFCNGSFTRLYSALYASAYLIWRGKDSSFGCIFAKYNWALDPELDQAFRWN